MDERDITQLSDAAPLADLYDRLCRALDKGTGIRLRPADVDWLIVSGAYQRILEAVAEVAFDEAVARIEARGQEVPEALLKGRGNDRTPPA